MKQEHRIFIWLAMTQRRTQFIQWAQENNYGSFSHSTLSRAMERQYTGQSLTSRQSGIAEAAKEFRKQFEPAAA